MKHKIFCIISALCVMLLITSCSKEKVNSSELNPSSQSSVFPDTSMHLIYIIVFAVIAIIAIAVGVAFYKKHNK